MEVLDALAREHSCFRAMLNCLESYAASVEEESHFRACALLRVLLSALDRHEEIEDIAFGPPLFAPSMAPAALALVDAQHKALESLRLRLLETLESSEDRSPSKVAALVPLLIAPLRAHLETEERLLWPSYRYGVTIHSDQALYRRIEPRIKILEKTLARAVETAP